MHIYHYQVENPASIDMDLDSPAAIGSGVRESSIDMNFDSLAALVSHVKNPLLIWIRHVKVH